MGLLKDNKIVGDFLVSHHDRTVKGRKNLSIEDYENLENLVGKKVEEIRDIINKTLIEKRKKDF